jgi:hypothetical protein
MISAKTIWLIMLAFKIGAVVSSVIALLIFLNK